MNTKKWWSDAKDIPDVVDKYYKMQDVIEKYYEDKHEELIKKTFESKTEVELVREYDWRVSTLSDFKFYEDIYDIDGYETIVAEKKESLKKLEEELEPALEEHY